MNRDHPDYEAGRMRPIVYGILTWTLMIEAFFLGTYGVYSLVAPYLFLDSVTNTEAEVLFLISLPCLVAAAAIGSASFILTWWRATGDLGGSLTALMILTALLNVGGGCFWVSVELRGNAELAIQVVDILFVLVIFGGVAVLSTRVASEAAQSRI
jgi:hypothetical protein